MVCMARPSPRLCKTGGGFVAGTGGHAGRVYRRRVEGNAPYQTVATSAPLPMRGGRGGGHAQAAGTGGSYSIKE